MGRRRVLVVDDHAVVRAGLRAILNTDPGLDVVGEAEDGEDGCAQAEALRPEIVIMDVSMPTVNGAEATRRVLTVSPASRVIALTAHEEPPYVRGLLDAGARGYVLKRAMIEHLTRAIHVVAEGGVFLDPALANRPATQSTAHEANIFANLSLREVEVAALTASGHSNSEIAAALGLSVRTIETHKTRLMTKLELRTRAQLVRYAIYRGWLAT